jgi:hypothetical protein
VRLLGETGRRRPNKIRDIMRLDSVRITVAVLGVALLTLAAKPTLAQSTDTKATEQRSPNGDGGKDGQKKNEKDEFAEAEKLLGGPAANPECMWLGRRVVSLLWRDDLDTAFRHLDLYDRFGCPAGHIQTYRSEGSQGAGSRKTHQYLLAESRSFAISGCGGDGALPSPIEAGYRLPPRPASTIHPAPGRRAPADRPGAPTAAVCTNVHLSAGLLIFSSSSRGTIFRLSCWLS